MTQALSTNYDILNNRMLTAEQQPASNDSDVAIITGIDGSVVTPKFNKILDKTIQKADCTIGDIKNNVNHTWDMAEMTDNFRETLMQASQEVNMENSLDLTLARDINEIVGQLQAAVSVVMNADFESINAENSNYTNAESLNTLIDEINMTEDYAENTKIAKAVDLKTDEQTFDVELDVDADMLDELNIESVRSETSYSDGESATQQESAEEFGVKIMLNQNIEKFDSSMAKTLNAQSQSKPVEVSSEKIIEQITKHLDSIKTTSKVNIVLNPESLGKVNLQIINSKDGLSAQFTVTTNEARDLLMKGIDGLRENLLAQGVSVDNISVKVSEAEEPYNPDWTEQQDSEGGNKEQARQNKEEKEKGLFEKTMTENLKKKNGNV